MAKTCKSNRRRKSKMHFSVFGKVNYELLKSNRYTLSCRGPGIVGYHTTSFDNLDDNNIVKTIELFTLVRGIRINGQLITGTTIEAVKLHLLLTK